MNADSVVGCLLGTAVGDSLGLPFEGMAHRRARRIFPEVGRHQFFFSRGMVSDDTEHTCFVAQAISAANGNPDEFERHLAGSLRWWLLGLPGGVGFATLRAILKLWVGFSPQSSGVFSAGNGPSMRSPIVGVVFGSKPDELIEYVKRSTRITHTDPKALFGAVGVALAAHFSANGGDFSGENFVTSLDRLFSTGLSDIKGDSHEFMDLMVKACQSAGRGESIIEFAASIGCGNGITGYTYHTVPAVIQAWLRHRNDFRSGMEEILKGGGDTDTTGAILGGIIGAGVGKAGIPVEWINGITDWPCNAAWMEKLGHSLHSGISGETSETPGRPFLPLVFLRNLVFLAIVFAHGFRRLAPPY